MMAGVYQRLRCFLFRHDTRIATGDEGQIVCRRCGAVLDRWPLLRPEHQVRQARQDAAFWADRERRAQGLRRPKVVRMR